MKKSALYFSAAAASFLFSITWSFIVFLDYGLLTMVHLDYPLVGFAFMFPAIWLVKKGNEQYNTEHNQSVHSTILLKGVWKKVNYIVIGLLTPVAIVMLVKVLVDTMTDS